MSFIKFFALVGVLLCSSYLTAMQLYQVDTAPFAKYPKLFDRYNQLQEKFDQGPLSIAEHKERVNILTNIIKREPNWWDGYWILASESFILGSSLPDPETNRGARDALVYGKNFTDKCLQAKPDQILCKFFRASLMAKIASIDGIFASLKHGKEIRDAWEEVAQAKFNFNFRPNVTLLGSSYYGLGIFYRLVPDNFLIDWFWGIRGNKDKSIDLHRKAVSFDKKNPCSMLMLSVALLCRYGVNPKTPEVREAYAVLDRIESITPIDIPQAICQADVPKIKGAPHKTCGYTQAKYQPDEPVPEKK